jgi:glycosyltransferase involved in cell wall biosynthesis
MKKIVLFLSSEPLKGGNFQYSHTVLDALSALPKAKYDCVVIYVDSVWEDYIDNNLKKIKVVLNHFTKRLFQGLVASGIPLPLLRLLINNFCSVAKIITKQNADLYIYPSQESLWSYITNHKSLETIHDLMHRYERRFPEAASFLRYFHREKQSALVAKFAKGILVDSEYGKKQFCNSYSVAPDRVFILPYIAPRYMYETQNNNNFNFRYTLPPKYIFYPAQFWRHKNHDKLIQAVSYLKKEIPNIHLILVGSKKNSYIEVRKLVLKLGLENSVHFMGYVSNEDLQEFYRRARALVMPTFFGPTNIPPLEAFVVGCPVAISNVYGIPEQVGDAALLFNPESIEEIAYAIRRLWMDDNLCKKLAEKGREKSTLWGRSQFNEKFQYIVDKLLIVECQDIVDGKMCHDIVDKVL